MELKVSGNLAPKRTVVPDPDTTDLLTFRLAVGLGPREDPARVQLDAAAHYERVDQQNLAARGDHKIE